jgi:hypothetical protein
MAVSVGCNEIYIRDKKTVCQRPSGIVKFVKTINENDKISKDPEHDLNDSEIHSVTFAALDVVIHEPGHVESYNLEQKSSHIHTTERKFN